MSDDSDIDRPWLKRPRFGVSRETAEKIRKEGWDIDYWVFSDNPPTLEERCWDLVDKVRESFERLSSYWRNRRR